MLNEKSGLSSLGIGLIIGVSVLLIGGVVFLLLGGLDLLNFAPSEGDCQIVSENVGKNKIDIVFFTNNVSGNKVRGYVDFFLASKPFSESKKKFNFYYAGESNCEVIQEKAVYCYSKELIRDSAVCPNDFVVVLSDMSNKMRSSAYMNVMSVNVNHPKNVLLHEFGHVFANLADEYVPSTIPWGSKNCQSECDKFAKFGDLEGCYVGCSKSDFTRSTENSIMRTLKTSDFGKLNTMLINEDLEKYD